MGCIGNREKKFGEVIRKEERKLLVDPPGISELKTDFFNLRNGEQWTREEALACMPGLGQRCLEAIFSERNAIGFKEIMIVLIMLGPDSFLRKMSFVFDLFDNNKNGILDEAELQDFFLSVSTIIYKFSIAIIRNELKHGEESEWEIQSKKRMEEILPDFLSFMMRKQRLLRKEKFLKRIAKVRKEKIMDFSSMDRIRKSIMPYLWQ